MREAYEPSELEPIKQVEIYFNKEGNPVIEVNGKVVDRKCYELCSEIMFGIGCDYRGIICKRANYMVNKTTSFNFY